MKQKKLLTLTFSQLKQIFNQELPELVEIAEKSTTVEDFKAELLTFSETCVSTDYSTALQVSDGNAGKYGNADGFVY